MDALKSDVDKWATKYIEEARLPFIALSIVKDGKVVLQQSYSSEVQTKVDEHSPCSVFSCTKVATAVAALQLLEKGLWNLEDPVEKFLPKFAMVPGVIDSQGQLQPLDRPISMRHLLTHTSGMTYSISPTLSDGRQNPVQAQYVESFQSAQTLEELIDNLAKLPLVEQPGSTWNYSVGIDVIGRVVEVLSGMTFDMYLDEHIFKPLGMDSLLLSEADS